MIRAANSTKHGALAFAKPLSISELVKDVPFNKFDTSYDAKISEIFEAHDVDVVEEAFDIGDVVSTTIEVFTQLAGTRH